MMIQAILFDSDGVLVDTEWLFFEATCTAFASEGIAVSGPQWARWYLAEGKRSREIAALLGMAPSRVEAVIARRDELFWGRIDQGVPVLPGVRETLDHLANDFRLALVTGASRRHWDRIHAGTGLRDYFEVVVAHDDYEHSKPHPQAYLTALQKLALPPTACLGIEDSPRGATAAVAAGIRCCIVPTKLTDLALCPANCLLLDKVTRLIGLLEAERASPGGRDATAIGRYPRMARRTHE